ncbi:nuclear transcription factor Y subunit B-3-like protein [Cinnamomum micranthum f. kanehirae]|uniref:Nuclear transcription factor Y subunit B-3-like protein n=1 Tax=Cinnamomum micranthum f. kanehirae TaxID=337451 RepID=A0A3S3MZN8_9MAGN|nr:nuclear transcription factor Y subunit B-3-like protein [Cinnamomum micranthum f. kanehirae]
MAGRTHHLSPDSSPPSDNESGALARTALDVPTKDQDRLLPIANVSRIMKKPLPANAKISKEAKETVQECVSEFISFITGEASDKCQREKRKTINGDDLLWAMTTLGFENYVGPLKRYLDKYRETEGEKTPVARQGDQSLIEESNSKMVADPTACSQGFMDYSGGFYSAAPTSFPVGGRILGCGENSKMDVFNGGENGVRSAASHHHGVQW